MGEGVTAAANGASGPAIGLVGCGRWGRNILRDLVALGARVHVATPSGESRAVAEAGGAASVCADARVLPEGLDGYVVATPTAIHADTVDALLERGRPIFVEKPLTDDPVRARAIAAAAADRVFVMDKWRYHPGVVRLARAVRSGDYGTVKAIRTYRLGWGQPHTDVDPCWILLPHDLSIVIHILGTLPPLVGAVSIDPAEPGAGAVAWLGTAGGPRATVEISAFSPTHRRAVVVRCEKATLELGDSYDDAVTVRREYGDEPERLDAEGPLPLYAELAAFCAHLAGGPPPMSSSAEAVAVVERVAEIRAWVGAGVT